MNSEKSFNSKGLIIFHNYSVDITKFLSQLEISNEVNNHKYFLNKENNDFQFVVLIRKTSD